MAGIKVKASELTFEDDAPAGVKVDANELTFDDEPDDKEAAYQAKLADMRQRLKAGEFEDPSTIGSKLAAGVIGSQDSAMLGFADEAAGVGRVLGSGLQGLIRPGEMYRQGRDERRALSRDAQAAEPTASTVGAVGGGIASSFLPGLGLARGAGIGMTAAKAALQGGVQSIGDSEGPLDPMAIGKDALIAGATGGAISGALRGATGRVAKRALGDITDGATAKMRDKVVGRAGTKTDDVYELVRTTPGLAKAGGNAAKALKSVEAGLDDAGRKLDDAYKLAGDATPGIEVSKVVNSMEDIAARLEKDPGKRALARAVRGQIADVTESWGGRTHVTAQDVRVFAKDVGDAAFAGSPAVSPKQGASVSRDVWGSMKDLIEENITEASRKADGIDVKGVRALNQRMGNLISMRDALAYKATREATESTRLKDRVAQGANLLFGGMAVSGNVAPLAASMAYSHAAKPLGRAADRQLAKLVHAAQTGSTPAEIILRGAEWGIAPQTAQWVADKFAPARGSSPRSPDATD